MIILNIMIIFITITKTSFRRRDADPLHFVMFCSQCVRVATCCCILQCDATCCHSVLHFARTSSAERKCTAKHEMSALVSFCTCLPLSAFARPNASVCFCELVCFCTRMFALVSFCTVERECLRPNAIRLTTRVVY